VISCASDPDPTSIPPFLVPSRSNLHSSILGVVLLLLLL